MEEISIHSIEHLRTEIDKCGTGDCIFRGQSDSSWALEPSINRYRAKLTTINNSHCPMVGREKLDWAKKMRSLEVDMLGNLKNSYAARDTFGENIGFIEGLVNLQHYGAPTRLLDFTESPYIALFFAASEGESSFSLYSAATSPLEVVNNEEDLNLDYLWGEEGANEPRVYIYRPKFCNPRIEAQKGLFLFPSTTVLPFEKILDSGFLNMKKYNIPAKLRKDVVIMLNQMSISPKSVYPEVEGIVKSYAWNTLVKALA